MREFFSSQMDYVFFVYGLAFILLFSICFFSQKHSRLNLSWRWLGLFGLLHGINEWLDMLALSAGDNETFKWVRVVLMTVSFMCLFEFGRSTCERLEYTRIGRWVYLPLLLAVFLVIPSGVSGVNAVSRYSFGAMGGLLATLALWQISKESRTGAGSMTVAAAAMALYAVTTGLVVPRSGFLLAGIVNQDTFLSSAGFPVQVLRMFAACVISAMIYYYNEELYAKENAPQLARYGKNSAAGTFLGLFFILAAGWFCTDKLGREVDVVQRAQLLNYAQQSVSIVETDLVRGLAGDASDTEKPAYQILKTRLQQLRQVMPSVRFIYFMRQVDGKVIFLVDSEPVGSKDESPPGQVYDEATSRLKGVFVSGKGVVDGPAQDRWGSWVSAYGPFHDGRTGEMIAVLGVDQDARAFNKAVAFGRLKGIVPAAVICFGILFGFAYWRRFIMALEQGHEIRTSDLMVHWGMALIVVAIGLTLTIILFFELQNNAFNTFKLTFLQRAISRGQIVSQELERQIDRLDGLARFMDSRETVEREEFDQYVTPLLKDVPIRAFEWVPKVARADRVFYESSARQDGLDGFRFYEKDARGGRVAAPDREDYFPVYYMQPLKGNEAALGFDLYAEPLRRAAMEKSRDMGRPIASPPLELVQEGRKKTGIIIFMPVYVKDQPLRTLDQRRKALKGYVLAVYSADDFLKGVYSRMPPEGLACLIEDLAAPAGRQVLYRHEIRDGAVDWDHVPLRYEIPLDIPDRQWRMTIVPGTSFVARQLSYVYWWVLPVGFLLTVFTAIFLNFLVIAQYRAERLVKLRTNELRKEKEALQDSEESYRRQFLDNSAPMFFVDPASGAILEVNRSAESFYGYSAAEFKNMRITDINAMPEDVLRGVIADIKSGARRRLESRHYLKDGAVRNVEVFASPILFHGRTVIHTIVHDITERKAMERLLLEAQQQLEEKVRSRTKELHKVNEELHIEINERLAAIQALEEANKKAGEANRLKSEFVATVSHEMRTPLNGIIGFAELIETSREPFRIQDMARTIVHQSETLLSLVNDILDHARIEAGKLTLKLGSVDIRELVARLCKPIELKLTGKNVVLTVEIAENVPVFLMTDHLRLGQVITNLLNNAVKFTEQGSVTLKIVNMSPNGPSTILRFAVVDTGVGIPAEKQHLIFERFAQVDGDLSRRFGGVGLGVSIAKGLVELMGGEIGFESRPGAGTEFWFQLPMEPAEAPRFVEAAPDRQAVASGRVKVLVAEDYAPNQEIVRMHLEGAGYSVRIAEDGKAALEACGQEEFQLVLMDIQMPGMDGYETTRQLRAQEGWLKHVPILGFTANADNKTLDECLAIGMNGVIVKPIRREPFLLEISKWSRVMAPVPAPAAAVPLMSLPQAGVMDYDEAVREFGGKTAFFHEVVQRFLLQAAQQLTTIDGALNARDAVTIGKEAHKIKGAAANLTAMRLSACALAVEMKGKANDLEGMTELVAHLRQEVAALESFIKNKVV